MGRDLLCRTRGLVSGTGTVPRALATCPSPGASSGSSHYRASGDGKKLGTYIWEVLLLIPQPPSVHVCVSGQPGAAQSSSRPRLWPCTRLGARLFPTAILRRKAAWRVSQPHSLRAKPKQSSFFLWGGGWSWAGQRDSETKAAEVQAMPPPEREGRAPQQGRPPLTWAPASPASPLSKTKPGGSAGLCASYKVCLQTLCLFLPVDKLDSQRHFEKRRKFIKCRVYARCSVYLIGILLTITLGDRDCDTFKIS